MRYRGSQRLALILSLVSFFGFSQTQAQLRKVFIDNVQPDNEIKKISFFSPSQGYVAFRDWIGYTTDTGRSFVKKYITLSNVDYNGYSVNLTFGFGINGVKAFDQNTLIAYGDYGLVPAILRSTDGGNTFKLVYHSQYNPLQLSSGITSMAFLSTASTGYAVDADRVIRTTDQGLTWSNILVSPGSFFDNVEVTPTDNVFVMGRLYNNYKLLRYTGSSFVQVNMPFTGVKLASASFISSSTGFVNVTDNSSNGYVYKTTNSGSSWTLMNDPAAIPFQSSSLKFIDINTGYALNGLFTVSKTTNGGALWEPLQRDNNITYLNYSHNDLFFNGTTQFWAGGGNGLLELATNAGGTPIPKAWALVDTVGYGATGAAKLKNYSGTGYSYQWYVNGQLVSTLYNATYVHDIYHTTDTIKLVNVNGALSDTTIIYQGFYPPVVVSSFSPTSGAQGTVVTINGLNFTGATSVRFGNTAASFTVNSSTKITATVGNGASGDVSVTTATGKGSLAGFTFIPPPVITAFAPTSVTAGSVVSFTGNNFINVSAVKFNGVPATSFAVQSPSSLTAVAPSGSSGTVSVSAIGGTGSLGGYVALPTINGFTPSSGTLGTVMTIAGTSLSNTTSVTIGGVPVQSFTVKNADTIVAIVAQNSSGTVVVSKVGGSSSFGNFIYYDPPVISGFLPMSGPIGTVVTITGTGFNTNPGANIVFFGAVRANVSASTGTTITVAVPVGATFEKITVTSNNLIAYSDIPFLVTFANGGAITSNSFAPTSISTSPNIPSSVQVMDMDGDGKADILVPTLSNLLIYRNTSTVSTVSFANPYTYSSGSMAFVGDLDGDGKPDMVFPAYDSLITVINTSTPGNFSFVKSGSVKTKNSPDLITIGDLDGDGKADVVVNSWWSSATSVHRNISNPGEIAFATGVQLSGGSGSRTLLIADIDGDGRADIVQSGLSDDNFYVYKNNCTKGNIVFDAPVKISSTFHSYSAWGDMDGDGKIDIVATDNDGSIIRVFRNLSTTSAISFASPILLSVSNYPDDIKVSDMDGDGKLDIVTVTATASAVMLKNISTPGNLVFLPKIEFVAGNFLGMKMLCLADFNGDGKNDAVVSSETARSITIHKNQVVSEPSIHTFTPSLAATGTAVTIVGANFTGVTAVTFGGVPASSFTINSSTSITAVVGAGASGNITVTNNYGTASRRGFEFGLPPVITSIAPLASAIGSSITIAGNNFSVTPPNNIVFFGKIRATVTAASANTLTVTVPAGASNEPITVTVNGKTGHVHQFFNVLFPGAAASFSSTLFEAPVTRTSGGLGTVADINNDGKLDLVMTSGSAMIVALNNSNPGTISFGANQSFPLTYSGSGTTAGDLDGDGKQDVVIWHYDGQSISIMRNTSTSSTVSFVSFGTYLTGLSTTRPSDAVIGDVDGDGRPDIVVANYYSRTISIFKNLGTAGNIMLDERIDYPVTGYPTAIRLKDVTGDGKPDIVLSVNGGGNGGSVFVNTSIPGIPSFSSEKPNRTNSWPQAIEVNDLDGDGKPDMVVANLNSSNLSIFRNQTVTDLQFAAKQDLSCGNGPYSLSIADFDGDGKADIVECNRYSGNNISASKNISSSNIMMQPKVDFVVGYEPFMTSVGDIDGDGRPDVVVYCSLGNTVFLRNKIQVLPLTLSEFAGKLINADVTLNWRTLSEQQTAYFDIQRSRNGVEFATVGSLAAAGGSNVPLDYSFTDKDAVKPGQTAYYRLFMVDKDGIGTYTKALKFSSIAAEKLVVYPNPMHAELNFSVSHTKAEIGKLSILDMSGKIVLETAISLLNGTVNRQLNLKELPAGIYQLTVTTSSTKLHQRIVKE